jgi:hypothetical protein
MATEGGAMSGKRATGKVTRDTTPKSTKNKEMTRDNMGLLMKFFTIILEKLCP